MKRIVKFRGKRIDNGEWVYGDLVTNFEYGISIMTKLYHVDGAEFNCDVFGVIPESVGQFTGLLDWADKEIYEGDFCKDHNGEIGVIDWNDDTAGWCRNVNDGQDDNTYRNVDFTDFKVIGSTTDTPELLTVK